MVEEEEEEEEEDLDGNQKAWQDFHIFITKPK